MSGLGFRDRARGGYVWRFWGFGDARRLKEFRGKDTVSGVWVWVVRVEVVRGLRVEKPGARMR